MDPIKILLVDDSKSARYALRLHLQQQGMQVDTADSAEAALERIPQSRPEAVLMDHTMPGMNGFEALDILKSDAATVDIPVVMCTSHDDPAYAAQALKRGALTVLSKADAAERLPDVLGQIRAALAARAELAAPPAGVPVEAAPAAPAAPTRAEIEEWIEAQVARRLAETMEPQLARLTTQLRQIIVEQVEMAVDALPPPAPAPVVAPTPEPPQVPPTPAIDIDQLRHDLGEELRQDLGDRLRQDLGEGLVPVAVRRHFDAERDQLLQLVQQCVHEANAPHEEDPDALRRTLDAVDGTITTRATQIARKEAEDVIQGAEAHLRQTLDALQGKLRASYALGAAALVLAIAAIALAFLA